jgi:phenolic acid decarboxylase
MLLIKIDTAGTRFRVAGTARPKQVKGEQARMRDGRMVWVVRLTAIEEGRNSAETIWVEVPGDEPVLTIDAQVHPVGLIYTPWVNRKGEIVRCFRADEITPAESGRKAA